MPAPPVPVENGLPPTPVLKVRTSPPSAPVPTAADWACAKSDALAGMLPPVVIVAVGLFVKAETGIKDWDGALEARMSAKEALVKEPDVGPLVIDAGPLDVPVAPIAALPVVEAMTPPAVTVPL